MKPQVSLSDLLDARKVNHCVRSRQKKYSAGKRDFFPWSVEIHPTTRCNYNCSYCAYKERNAFDRTIPDEALKSVYDVLKINRTKGVFFAGGGEPLFYPGIQDHIVYLERTGIEVAVLTNGSVLLNEKFQEMLSSLNYIAVSIPTLNEDEFKAITGRNLPERLFDLPALIRAERRKVPIVGSRLVVSKENYKSVIETVLKLRNAGYDYCIVKIPKDPEGRGLGISDDELASLREEYLKFQGEIAEDFTNIKSVLETARPCEPLGGTCWSIEYSVNCFIHTDGGVYLCLPLLGKREFCIGNIRDENFDDLWRGQRRLEVIELLQKRYKEGLCKGCRNIAYNNIIERFPDSGFSKDMDPFL